MPCTCSDHYQPPLHVENLNQNKAATQGYFWSQERSKIATIKCLQKQVLVSQNKVFSFLIDLSSDLKAIAVTQVVATNDLKT